MRMKRGAYLKSTLIILLILLTTVLHYRTGTEHRYLHELYQRFYYIPILLAAYWYGPLPGVIAAFSVSLLYLYHIEKDWTKLPVYAFNQYAEIVMYHAVALVIGFLSLRDRRQREKLEKMSQELAQAYDRLQKTFDQLRRADRLAALGQLSAGIAHEIRNPLGSIKGSIEILENEISSDNPKHEFIQIIKEETARLNSIIAEFLRFARPPKPSIESISLNNLIESTLVLFEKQETPTQVEIHKHLDVRLPSINLDPDQMRQVLLNVILNSMQAMPEGGVLDVRSGLDDERLRAVIEISDTGAGIDEENLERVFDPFFTTKPQGTGLGLAISHQLVQNHNGKISVRNNPDRGATFRIELPVEESRQEEREGRDHGIS
jgi:signal transduction histidine kinase